MTEKIGPKEAQVKALREARAARGKASVAKLRKLVDEVKTRPPKVKKRERRR